ncbi:MAG: DNA primase DnaG [archaeon]
MGKTYIGTVKYNIRCSFEITGVVDKHDIIGAVFGQSEGLIGDQMDLRELQQGGKIGRIEVVDEKVEGNSVKGILVVPSSLDMVQTSLLAAAIESIDKVGPYEAHFSTQQIEDARSEKRKVITDRAKELLKKLMSENLPESQEIEDEIRKKMRAAEIKEFGPDKLPSGPDVWKEEEIILVEGRADVINLLKHNINNVIGMNGSKIPESIIELCKRKKVTLFVDGDRGGELITRELTRNTSIEFIARAPDGKEVEELTGKEILASLRRKAPVREGVMEVSRIPRTFTPRKPFTEGRFPSRGPPRRSPTGRGPGRPPMGSRPYTRSPMRGPFIPMGLPPIEIPATEEEKKMFSPSMNEVKGKLEAVLLDEGNKEITRVKVRELMPKLKEVKGAHSIVFDGIITKRLVDEAKAIGVKNLVGVRKGKITEEEGIKTVILKP